MHARDELYHNMRGPARNLTVLSSAYSDPNQRGSGLHETLTWEVSFGKGRVIVTSMGHLWRGDMERGEQAALYCVGFQTILARACEYAATGQVTLPVPKSFPDPDNIHPVAPHTVGWPERPTVLMGNYESMVAKKQADPYRMLTTGGRTRHLRTRTGIHCRTLRC